MDKDLECNPTKSRRFEANDRSTSSIDSLPQEILLNVLSRLPVTSLVNAKFVCRSWKNIVCDPVLVRMHFSQMTEKNPSIILDYSSHVQSKLYFVQNSGHGEDNDSPKRIILPKMNGFIVAGSCRGLICMHSLLKKNEAYVFNPFTRNYLELPKAELLSINETVSFGFGFLPASKVYKLVRTAYYVEEDYYPDRAQNTKLSSVQILDLGSSSWRSIEEKYELLRQPSSHTLVNGRLHWLTFRCSERRPRKLVSFDLTDEQFRIVPEPNNILCSCGLPHLVILGGCLSLVTDAENSQLDIWIMREYDVKESWSKSFSINAFHLPKELNENEVRFPSISKSCINLTLVRVLCMLENGEILLDFKGRALLLYEPKSRTFKQLKYPRLPHDFRPIVHIGSLNWFENISNL